MNTMNDGKAEYLSQGFLSRFGDVSVREEFERLPEPIRTITVPLTMPAAFLLSSVEAKCGHDPGRLAAVLLDRLSRDEASLVKLLGMAL